MQPPGHEGSGGADAPAIAPAPVERIRVMRAAGMSLAAIAAALDADGVPTAHSGNRW
jgi:hypothetical protein